MKKLAFGAAVGAASCLLLRELYRASQLDESTFRELLIGLTFGPTPEAVLQRVTERAGKLVRADVYVERLDMERQELIATAQYGGHFLPPVGTRGPYIGSIAELAIATCEPILIRDMAKESLSILGTVKTNWPAVVFPLIADNVALGALIAIRKRPLRNTEVARLEVFATTAAISMRRLIVLEQLQQRTCELENAIHTRDELLRILAHDLRNPVSTIATAAAALENVAGTERLSAIIQRATIRMNRLIQDLLDQAVIERAGGLPMHREAHPAQSLTEEVCEMTRMHAKSKVVRVDCEVDAHASVYADRDRLFQVLTNLIDNALKFTPPGGSIRVRSEERNDHVQFSVSDSGPGIPALYQQKIFDPYFRAPGNSRPGSGLGLAIAKQIVVQHGGDIWVESAEGRGSTFTFTIPAKPLEQ